jgi:hypothetical protein
MLYTDGVHLIADSLHELYEYASKIGLNPEWIHFMGRNIHPHFDICGNVRRRVLQDEKIKQVSRREIVRLLKFNYRLPETEQEIKEWEAYHAKELDMEMPSEADYERMLGNVFTRTGIK